MAHKCVIDLSWRNLFTAAIDHIVLTAMKREKTFLINAADIARFEPSIYKARAIEFRRIKIARNYRWAAYQNLALFAWRKRTSIIAYDGYRYLFGGVPHVPGFEGPGGGRFAEICAASLDP